MQGFIYRLPYDQGFYFVTDKNAYLFEEEELFPTKIIELQDRQNVFDAFLQDLQTFGVNGFGFTPYRQLV